MTLRKFNAAPWIAGMLTGAFAAASCSGQVDDGGGAMTPAGGGVVPGPGGQRRRDGYVSRRRRDAAATRRSPAGRDGWRGGHARVTRRGWRPRDGWLDAAAPRHPRDARHHALLLRRRQAALARDSGPGLAPDPHTVREHDPGGLHRGGRGWRSHGRDPAALRRRQRHRSLHDARQDLRPRAGDLRRSPGRDRDAGAQAGRRPRGARLRWQAGAGLRRLRRGADPEGGARALSTPARRPRARAVHGPRVEAARPRRRRGAGVRAARPHDVAGHDLSLRGRGGWRAHPSRGRLGAGVHADRRASGCVSRGRGRQGAARPPATRSRPRCGACSPAPPTGRRCCAS